MAAPIDDGSKDTPRWRHINKVREKVDLVTSGMSRLGVAVATTLNPNHRHDEEHEKELDAKIEKIRAGHRFRSFAPDRPGNLVKWHIDGHGGFSWTGPAGELTTPDYFWALSELIDRAQSVSMLRAYPDTHSLTFRPS